MGRNVEKSSILVVFSTFLRSLRAHKLGKNQICKELYGEHFCCNCSHWSCARCQKFLEFGAKLRAISHFTSLTFNFFGGINARLLVFGATAKKFQWWLRGVSRMSYFCRMLNLKIV